MDTVRSPLLDDVNAFLKVSRMSPITFGRKAMNDPHFVRDLRCGRQVWPKNEARVRAFIVSQQEQAA